MKINAQRLQERLEKLGRIGASPGLGTTRSSLTPADLEARAQVKNWMEAAGMTVRLDAAANLIGRLPGRQEGPPIMVGSHIDTVPQGGIFDGALGVLGAIEAVQTLVENHFQPEHPIEVVSFINEEGTRFGKGLLGSSVVTAPDGPMDSLINGKGTDGVSFGEALRGIGLDPTRLGEARRSPGELKSFLEMHIEQGGILESEGIKIGIVEGIVTITRHWVTFRGKANHAGTTPMHLRKDALVGAADMVRAVRATVHQMGGRLVGTVGYLEVWPGGSNVIPGKVKMSVELRDMDAAIIAEASRRLAEQAHQIAAQYGLSVDIETGLQGTSVPTHPAIQAIIEEEAQRLGLSTKRMVSGAGHDAQNMAKICPIGMIFIPSRDGISHSPDEWSDWEDVAAGTQVMLQSLLRIDAD